ncbi:MAG TPA: TlpA disulfide reductase family protein [Phnomibacter sp.]|nr:TlpA disulfide reductase family protein [Phnomibacter sp.]
MRPIFTKLLILLSMAAYSQQSKTKPVIIQGKFENFTDSILYFYSQDELYRTQRSIIKVNPDGSFYHETSKIKQPDIENWISNDANSISHKKITLSPGFNLQMTADAKDAKTFESTLRFSGNGAEVNTAWQQTNSILANAFKDVPYRRLSPSDLKNKMIELQQYMSHIFDSLLRIYNLPDREPYVLLHDYEVFFANCAYLCQELSGRLCTPTERLEELDSFLKMKKISSLFQDKFLAVSNYRFFLNQYASLKTELSKTSETYFIKEVKYALSIPPKKVRDYLLYNNFDKYIYQSRSYEGVIWLQEKVDSLYSIFSNKEYETVIHENFEKKLAQLKELSIGKTIPDIPLPDSLGALHKFSSFRGKVLYIDLWASWCPPCRAENPALKKIVESYESRSDVQFLSISIDKASSDWKKAVRDDQMHWLQLIDDNNQSMSNALFVQSVPRYVIVNKEGKIVTFDGPRPRETEKVKALIDAELAK